MKNILIFLFVLFGLDSFGQALTTPKQNLNYSIDVKGDARIKEDLQVRGGSVIGDTTLNGNASLELVGTAKGFLPNRLTTAQQNAIVAPANGLTIYNTDSNALVRYDSDNGWRQYAIGAGSVGATGPTGPTGATGAQGATGATGVTTNGNGTTINGTAVDLRGNLNRASTDLKFNFTNQALFFEDTSGNGNFFGIGDVYEDGTRSIVSDVQNVRLDASDAVYFSVGADANGSTYISGEDRQLLLVATTNYNHANLSLDTSGIALRSGSTVTSNKKLYFDLNKNSPDAIRMGVGIGTMFDSATSQVWMDYSLENGAVWRGVDRLRNLMVMTDSAGFPRFQFTCSGNWYMGDISDGLTGNGTSFIGIDSLGFSQITANNAFRIVNSIDSVTFQVNPTNRTAVFRGDSLLLDIGSTEGAGKVLTSDADGLATWQAASGGGWGLTGNAGTTAGTNFIGTSDDEPLQLETNATRRVTIDTSGNVTVGNYNRQTGFPSGVTNFYPLLEAIDSVNRASNILVINKQNGTASRCGFYALCTGAADSASYGGMGMLAEGFSDANAADKFFIQSGGHTNGTWHYADAGAINMGVGVGTAGTFVNPWQPNFWISPYFSTSGVAQTNPHPGTIGLNTNTPSAELDIVAGNLLFTNGSTGIVKRALEVTGTLGTGADVAQNAVFFDITSGANAAVYQKALGVNLNAGYTGSTSTGGIGSTNLAASTGNDMQWTTHQANPLGNTGFTGFALGTTTGANIGSYTEAENGNLNIGVFGKSALPKNSATNIGVVGHAMNTGSSPVIVGGYFYTDDVAPTIGTSATLIANNGATAIPPLIVMDNGSAVLTVADGGALTSTSTLTTTGLSFSNKGINTTSGDAATINGSAGRFRKDNSGATFTLTNSFITANSIIVLTAANAAIDATATGWTVSAGAGSATITFNAAPTADFDMNFTVTN